MVQQEPYVVGVDPGTKNASICVMQLDEQLAHTWECRVDWWHRDRKPRPEDIARDVLRWLEPWLKHPNCKAVAVERQMRGLMIRVEQACLATAQCFGKPCTSVHPLTWKKDYWRLGDVKGWEQNKAASRAVALQLYPSAQLTHNMSDALLIALHCARVTNKSMAEKMVEEFLK